jgi:hypothetical protein
MAKSKESVLIASVDEVSSSIFLYLLLKEELSRAELMFFVSAAGLCNKEKEKQGFIYFACNGFMCESEYSALRGSTVSE